MWFNVLENDKEISWICYSIFTTKRKLSFVYYNTIIWQIKKCTVYIIFTNFISFIIEFCGDLIVFVRKKVFVVY